MSLIIEDDFFSLNLIEKFQSINAYTYSGSILSKFPFQSQVRNRSFQILNWLQFTDCTKKRLKIVIVFRKKLFGLIDVWYTATLDEKAIYIEEKLIISKDQIPFKINWIKKKLLALKQISRNKIGEPKYTKIYITEEGIIQIWIPKMNLNSNVINSLKFGMRSVAKSQAFGAYVQNIISFMLEDSRQTLKNIFNTLTNIEIKQQVVSKQIAKESQQNNMKFQLYRYLVRSPVQLRFDCTEGSALYQQVVDITLTQQKQIQDRINYMKYANELKLTSLNIYFYTATLFEGKQKQAFYMTAKQKEITKNLLQIPQIIPMKQGPETSNLMVENKYMFNNIVLQLPKQDEYLILLAESGFGRLQFGTFNFWYLMNSKSEKSEMQQSLKQSNKIKKKYLVVKSPKSATDYQGNRKYYSKQMHQIKIINRLKGLSCALIPRFYQVERFYPEPFTQLHNQYIQKYQHALLSELTSCYGQPGYNIGHFLQERWNFLTHKKVIFIMSQVAQALRFLHINKIVHLDLKPQNILFLKNYSVKLIDFGESFHPLVPYQSSTPAYTYPYGCPQIAQNPHFFCDKSDVFSFGIILYELLYGKDIISTSPQALLREYKNSNYSKKIFFNPQQLQNHGDNFILPMLNHLIIKSLSPQIDSRPSMTWISVLLKNYLQILF